jgi:hypothetical protein
MSLPNPDPSEVSRRYASTYSAPQETPAGTKPPVSKRVLKDDNHAVVLVNLAHQSRRPKSDKASIRILGFFKNAEAAKEHSLALEEYDPACALAIVDTCSWYVLTKSQDVEPAAVNAKLNRLLEKHKQSRIEHKLEFEKHRAELRGDRKPLYQHEALNPCETEADMQEVPGAGGGAAESKSSGAAEKSSASKSSGAAESVVEQGGESNKIVSAAVEGAGHKVKPLPSTLEQRNMKSAVISVMNDYDVQEGDPSAELAFAIYDGFETDELAQTYVEHVAKRIVQDHDIAVVAMYEWLFPELRDNDAVTQVERNAELNRIMSARRARDSEVNTFKNMCAELKVDVPYKDILPDLGEDKLPVHPEAECAEGKSSVTIKATDTTPSPEELKAKQQKEKEEKDERKSKRDRAAAEMSKRTAF